MDPRIAKLEELYAKLPKLKCKGLCSEACGPISASAVEIRRLEITAGRRLGIRPDLTCSMLSPDKKCIAYEARPLICRLYGMVKQMQCEHGCVPDRWVGEKEARGLLAEALKIGDR